MLVASFFLEPADDLQIPPDCHVECFHPGDVKARLSL